MCGTLNRRGWQLKEDTEGGVKEGFSIEFTNSTLMVEQEGKQFNTKISFMVFYVHKNSRKIELKK